QKQIAELFEVNVPAISKHLKNIFETNELEEESVISKMETTASDGKKYKTNFYNLKVITAVGYRVNSHRATQFRKWATTILEEYIIKGFAMDDERLKNIHHFGKDYFDEQLDRIREIRLSERRFYQKITDIYSLSADYDKEADITKDFYATVQNKMHWAICGKTAAEIIYSEADAQKIYMGLKTWKNAPDGKILKSDVTVAKNYLNKEHIEQLKRIVSAYLDLAEDRAKRGIVMNMNDWILFLDKFLALSDYPILLDNGKISALEAKLKAHTEFEKYRVIQDKEYLSDFDKLLLEMEIK
ncbi:virulence RhuM family protein, partial [Aliarcobacter butzleri]|nr:virulence RhuM family protein [Aliarcobacter butzleri]